MKTIHSLCPVPDINDGKKLEARQKAMEPFQISKVVEVKYVLLDQAPTSIEDELDDALCIPDLVRHALTLQKSGSSGIFVDCMCDPGVRVLRSVLEIPVIGAAETAFHMAASLSHKFSVIDIGEDTGPMVEDLIHRYGLRQNFASVRGTGIPVEHIGADQDKTHQALAKEALAAVEQDRADFIVLGCTGFTGCDEAVRKSLLSKGHHVPVLDPRALGIRVLTAIALQGIMHSKKAWPTPKPTDKRLVGFDKDDRLQKFYST